MRRFFQTLVLISLVGCSQAGQGKLIAPATRASVRDQLDHKTDYHEKRVSLDGYIFLTSSTEQTDSQVGLALYSKPMGQGDRLVDFQVEAGQGKNQVHLPTIGKGKSAGYRRTEHKVDMDKATFTDADGRPHPLREQVRISGTVRYVKHFQGGFSKMKDPMDSSKELYPFALHDVRLDLPK